MSRRLLFIVLLVAIMAGLTVVLATADGHLAMVSVGHGIPGEDGLPVDVNIEGADCIPDFTFGNFVGPLGLEPGTTYTVSVSLADDLTECGENPAVIGPVGLVFDGGKNYTVFAHLAEDGTPTATVFENDVSDVVAGHTRVTVRHTAAAPAVDLFLNRGWVRGRSIGEFYGIVNPEQIGPVDLRPGAYAATIVVSGTDTIVLQIPATEDDRPLVTHPHRSHIVYAVGTPDLAEPENSTFQLLIQNIDLGKTPPPRPTLPE